MDSSNVGDFVYFAAVFHWLSDQVDNFGIGLMNNVMRWMNVLWVTLVSLWIMLQGYRMITGQSHGSMTALVMQMTRAVLIVSVATTMTLLGSDLHDMLTKELPSDINNLISKGSSVVSSICPNADTSPSALIDCNLAFSQVAMTAIDAVQVPIGDTETANTKARSALIATFGAAGPAMTAGAMLMLYQITLALFIGLGPLFIMCLMFDQTKDLFRKWLMYGIGTMFSLGVLSFVTSIVLNMTLRVAAAFWATEVISQITGISVEGYNSQALQQGGIGLLMTVLIISTPPLAAAFFQGTVGGFIPFAQVGGAANSGRPGPQGQPAGSYGGHGAPSSTPQANSGQKTSGGLNPATAPRLPNTPIPDAIKTQPPSSDNR